MKQALAVVGIVVVAAVVSVGGYLGGWWIQADSTNRQAHIDRENVGTQNAYRNEIHRKIADVTDVDVQLTNPALTADQHAALSAQRTAMIAATCDIAVNAVDLPSDETSWVSVHCN